MKTIALAELEKNMNAFLAAMRGCHVDVNQPFMPRKEVSIDYRGVPVSIIVMSPLDHYSVAIGACVRSVACHLGLLPSLWCEADLAGVMGQTRTKKVDTELLKAAKMSRRARLVALADEFATSPNIERVFEAKKNFLCSIDWFFPVELAFWFGSMGETTTARASPGGHLEVLAGPGGRTSRRRSRTLSHTSFALWGSCPSQAHRSRPCSRRCTIG